MDKLLDWFEEHKYGVIGTLTIHTVLLFFFTMMQMRGVPTPEEVSDMRMEVIEIDDAEKLLNEIDHPEMAIASRSVTNLTSNITAQTMATFSPHRLAERVEQDLKQFEQQEFEKLAEERRERGEEIVIPELDPSKWNKERYMDKAAEPVKIEGATTVWHDLEGRTRENDAPGYLCRTQGRVAVRVTVDARGMVQRAELDHGRSANADECMIEHALRSSRRARFSSGPASQNGTVFFLFMPQ